VSTASDAACVVRPVVDRVQAGSGGGERYERLVGLKSRWDPGNLFRTNQDLPVDLAAVIG